MQNYSYMLFVLLSSAFLVTVAMTFVYKIAAQKMGVIVEPNHRSSGHIKPVPTGGGIIIAFVYIWSVIYFLFFIEQVSPAIFQIAVGMAMGAIAITIVGFVDDVTETSATTKLLIQIMLCIWIIFVFLENLQTMFDLMSGLYYWPFIFVAIFLLVWLINVFNFMDAIDGMVLSGSILIAWSSALLIFMFQGNNENSVMLFLLGVICLGFLIFNFPPASIFMGDSGSLFLGYFFAFIIVKTLIEGDINFWTWLILLGHFLTETTFTLLMRMKLTKNWYKAHNHHPFQNLARILNSHTKVTSGSIIFYLLWLLPLAFISEHNSEIGLLFFLLAIFPVFLLTIKFGPLFSEKKSGMIEE